MGRIFLIIFLIFACRISNGQVRLNSAEQKPEEIILDYRNPRIYEISEITVTGSRYLDKNALISISSLKVGDKIKIPGDDISGAIKKLWETGITGDVAIYVTSVFEDKVTLNIDLTERPRLTKINFEGISKTQQTELNDQIKLIRGKILTDVTIKNTELAVKKYFVEKGYLNTEAKVLPKEDTLVSNGVQITIRIDKKQKVKIDRINLIGNKDFQDALLVRKMKKTNEYLRFNIFDDIVTRILHPGPGEISKALFTTTPVEWKDVMTYLNRNVKLNIFRTSKFIKEEYENDKRSMITFYNSKGYRDALIVSDSIYRSGENTINIDLYVEEGIKYYFRDIIWTGNFVYEDDVLNEVLGVKKGDIYDMELIRKKLTFNPNGTDLNGLYMDFGYLAFQCTPIETRIENDSIDVEMRINEGKQFDINKVIVKGNERTSDHVIYREIRTLPGQKFSRANLIRTQRELSALGYFDPEQIGINPIPDFPSGKVDIEYTLVERPSDQIELSGGWGGFYGFIGTLGIVFNNFSLRNITRFSKWRPLPVGDGQRLQARVQANGRAFQSYSFSFTEPWLGGKKPNSFTFSLQRSVQRYDFLYRASDLGSLKLTGGSLSLGRRIRWPDDYFTLSNSLSYYIYELDNYGTRLGFSTGTSNNISFNTTLARNSIDAPMYPRSGSSLSLSLTLTPPYSLWRDIDYKTADNATKYKWVEFHKWMFDASFFMRLAGDLVANTRAHFGYIGSYGVDVGPFERYVMGGSGLTGQDFLLGSDILALRGYKDRSITPIDRNGISGGTAFNKFVFELRYPVSLNPSATIFVLSFLEGGNNWNYYGKIDPFNIYRSAGFGARIFMPAFGLLGIDWAYGFDDVPGAPDANRSQFHFSIGQQFR